MGLSAVAIIIGSIFVFFLVLINPNAEAILKAADQAGLGLSALIMLCMIAIHGVIFHIAYGWYAHLLCKKIIVIETFQKIRLPRT